MAVCDWCELDMAEAGGCDQRDYTIAGEVYQPIPYGAERRWQETEWKPLPRCHDCNVVVGRLHHPGCDGEECPRCHWQAIGCECEGEEDEEKA